MLFFVLARVTPLTVAARVIPRHTRRTGLTGISPTFGLVAAILAV